MVNARGIVALPAKGKHVQQKNALLANQLHAVRKPNVARKNLLVATKGLHNVAKSKVVAAQNQKVAVLLRNRAASRSATPATEAVITTATVAVTAIAIVIKFLDETEELVVVATEFQEGVADKFDCSNIVHRAHFNLIKIGANPIT